MKIQYMREYVSVVENHNFTRAAEHCYIAQPSLSKHMMDIEKEPGCQLLVRTKHRVEATELGLIVYEGFRKIINQYDSVLETVERVKSGLHGVLRISLRRSGDGNYRVYSSVEIFQLFEALRYKQWGINIGEIPDIVSHDYFDQISARLGVFDEKISREIAYQTILERRVAQVAKRLRLSRCNGDKMRINEVRQVLINVKEQLISKGE